MENQRIRAILCPNCRRLVSSDEPICPHCGFQSPGSRLRNNFLTRGFLGGEQLIRNIIILNVGMFILSILLNPSSTGFSLNPFGFLSPGSKSLLLMGGTGTIAIDRMDRWWSLLSANYLHGSILHIFFNMMAIRQIGPLIIQEYGINRAISIYTLSGTGGFLVSYLAGVPLTIGASAALCGFIGAALYYGKSRGGYFGQSVYQQVGAWAIGIFLFGFLVPGIDNWGHGGGMFFGALTAFIFGYQERKPETFFDKATATVCIVATLGTLIWAVGSALMIIAQG